METPVDRACSLQNAKHVLLSLGIELEQHPLHKMAAGPHLGVNVKARFFVMLDSGLAAAVIVVQAPRSIRRLE